MLYGEKYHKKNLGRGNLIWREIKQKKYRWTRVMVKGGQLSWLPWN